jgi:hypothetical protein
MWRLNSNVPAITPPGSGVSIDRGIAPVPLHVQLLLLIGQVLVLAQGAIAIAVGVSLLNGTETLGDASAGFKPLGLSHGTITATAMTGMIVGAVVMLAGLRVRGLSLQGRVPIALTELVLFLISAVAIAVGGENLSVISVAVLAFAVSPILPGAALLAVEAVVIYALVIHPAIDLLIRRRRAVPKRRAYPPAQQVRSRAGPLVVAAPSGTAIVPAPRPPTPAVAPPIVPKRRTPETPTTPETAPRPAVKATPLSAPPEPPALSTMPPPAPPVGPPLSAEPLADARAEAALTKLRALRAAPRPREAAPVADPAAEVAPPPAPSSQQETRPRVLPPILPTRPERRPPVFGLNAAPTGKQKPGNSLLRPARDGGAELLYIRLRPRSRPRVVDSQAPDEGDAPA